MRGQIGGLAQAQRNAQDGISLVQTAEGALTEVHSMLQRVRDLKVQFDNGTLSDDDKDAIAAEVEQLGKEISDIVDQTEVQRHRAARRRQSFTFQVGANDGRDGRDRHGRPLSGTAGVGRPGRRRLRPPTLDAASRRAEQPDRRRRSTTTIKNVSTARADFGAVQNRLEHRLNNLATYQENLTASESRIRDVDMAAEMTKFTKLKILQQAGTSMLAQANQAPQGVLSLLR